MPTGQWIGDALPEPEPPREGRWIAKPLKPRFGIVHFAFIGVYVQLFLHLPKALGALTGQSWPALLTLALLLALFFWFLIRQFLARREGPSDRALMDAAFGDQFSAELTIVVDGKRIGADRGVVWFADGLFGFSGRNASFVLASRDIAPHWPGVATTPLDRSLPADAIVLVDAPYAAYVVVTPLMGHEKPYRERLRRFMFDAEEPNGERLWPPLGPFDGKVVDGSGLPQVNG